MTLYPASTDPPLRLTHAAVHTGVHNYHADLRWRPDEDEQDVYLSVTGEAPTPSRSMGRTGLARETYTFRAGDWAHASAYPARDPRLGADILSLRPEGIRWARFVFTPPDDTLLMKGPRGAVGAARRQIIILLGRL